MKSFWTGETARRRCGKRRNTELLGFQISRRGFQSMEVAGEDGSKLVLRSESATAFGRGSGVTSRDRTVSRRHLLLETKIFKNSNEADTEPRVSFEVIGRNPIWVRSGTDEEIRTFRRSEKGEMAPGDSFCVGGKQPSWFNLKKVAESKEVKQIVSEGEVESAESSGRSLDLEDIDVSDIDPVKEFGFLVLGHEFDCYGKRVIRDPKKWNWFLEEPTKNSDSDDDYERKGRTGARRKRKKGALSDDEDWTDEHEDEMEIIAKTKKDQRPKYSTRLKDRKKPQKDTGGAKAHVQKKTAYSNEGCEEDENEDEDDETLGGFIVDDEIDNEEQMDEDDEEEEFLDDDEEED